MRQREVIPADARWVEKNIREFSGSPSARIGDGWMLLTAGDTRADRGNWNTMTASWGGLGVLWGKDVAFVFVRPVRHSYGFFNAAPLFSLSFFEPSLHKALEICGGTSGRDTDKAAEAGLTPIVFDGPEAGALGFQEAREIIICRKLYTHDFDPAGFLDPAIDSNYPQKDYHRMFIGEITGFKVKA
ncbi:MAG: flavin reductase family protein [Spirochaetaceae bacterium]|jgi:flavin reductase (DIM6/NTAB) family NADH-FMN oxidoreductase RutF|nr:flavin reductase family protein [Spirochaetaceae bacterium]